MEIVVEINPLLKKRLLYIADHVLHGGHWGNSDLLIPEQQILLNILKNSEYYLCLSLFNCKMLIDWVKETTGQGSFMLQEDIYLTKNLSTAIADFYTALSDNDLYEQRLTENLIVSLDRLLYRHNKKNEHVQPVAEHVDLTDKQNVNHGKTALSSFDEKDNSQFRKIETKLNTFLRKHNRQRHTINKKELKNQLKNVDIINQAHKKES